ncbi:MAG: DNA alkylation repair protein [Muribaculaceae bacterium]|nr:DNA alkylation repair protein [Muribaculaceae bacterium]MDE6360449.1 DNA alkylation repair protein [Muribaculaceae bacterium]
MSEKTSATQSSLNEWQDELNAVANPEKAKILSRFFKTGEGEYGYGDRFIGVTVPANRAISKGHADDSLDTIAAMATHPIHEYRLGALLALVARYRKHPEETTGFYLRHLTYANNWDLIDLSAPYILGEELRKGRHHETIRQMARDRNLWIRRAAVVSTLRPVMKSRDTTLSLEMCHLLVSDPHDLMRKAVGWVLRETGKKDLPAMLSFLESHIDLLSATTLSYATEKLTPEERAYWRQRRKDSQPRRAKL